MVKMMASAKLYGTYCQTISPKAPIFPLLVPNFMASDICLAGTPGAADQKGLPF